MIQDPIYKPSGRALEYSPDALALNIYTGCPHRCYYCFAPGVLHKTREEFHSNIAPRPGIVDAVKRQLDKGQISDKLIHLSFTCDPYPVGYDTAITREIIKAIKQSGNHVQILTKGGLPAVRDFDLLDDNDWFGVSYTGIEQGELFKQTEREPNAAPHSERLFTLKTAHLEGIKTWMSCEPVLVPRDVLTIIEFAEYVDLFRIGKLNYHPSDTDWKWFGHASRRICENTNRNYYIKHDLHELMLKEVE